MDCIYNSTASPDMSGRIPRRDRLSVRCALAQLSSVVAEFKRAQICHAAFSRKDRCVGQLSGIDSQLTTHSRNRHMKTHEKEAKEELSVDQQSHQDYALPDDYSPALIKTEDRTRQASFIDPALEEPPAQRLRVSPPLDTNTISPSLLSQQSRPPVYAPPAPAFRPPAPPQLPQQSYSPFPFATPAPQPPGASTSILPASTSILTHGLFGSSFESLAAFDWSANADLLATSNDIDVDGNSTNGFPFSSFLGDDTSAINLFGLYTQNRSAGVSRKGSPAPEEPVSVPSEGVDGGKATHSPSEEDAAVALSQLHEMMEQDVRSVLAFCVSIAHTVAHRIFLRRSAKTRGSLRVLLPTFSFVALPCHMPCSYIMFVQGRCVR